METAGLVDNLCEDPHQALENAARFEGFRKIRDVAGLPDDVVPHGARGALASRAHRAGVEVNTIRVFLGHADISTTQEYLHVHENDLTNMAAKVQKKRGP